MDLTAFIIFDYGQRFGSKPTFCAVITLTLTLVKTRGIPRTKQIQQLARLLLALLTQKTDNLCCPRIPCVTRTEKKSSEQG